MSGLPNAQHFFVVGLSGGDVGLHCERWGCPWIRVIPPNSTLLDVERVTKTHTHPRKDAA